jgi:hypothetical protein
LLWLCYLIAMTKKTNPRKDFTQRAFDVFMKATGESEASAEQENEKKAQTEKHAPDEKLESEEHNSK